MNPSTNTENPADFEESIGMKTGKETDSGHAIPFAGAHGNEGGMGAEDVELAALRMHRRNLHQIPELDFDLPKTIAYVVEELERIRSATESNHGEGSCRVFSPCKSSVCALFDRETEHATAIRTDMDALPVAEMTMAPYASRHDGRMHACGHDGHMSMVLQLAQWLSSHFDELPRSVLLVFQPAEETTGGADDICKSGVFEEHGVDRIFGFHLWPDLPAGQIASRPGALLAACDETTAVFRGKSAHIAKAADGADALEACARFYLDAYDYIAQREAEEPCLLKFGRMEAGTVRNAIAKQAVIEGSLRTFSIEMRDRCKDQLPRLAKARAKETGCACDMLFTDGYPPVVNDADLYEKAREALAEADEGSNASADRSLAPTLKPIELPEPLLIAEDFAFYQRHLPGVFMLLGTGTGIPLHADTFDFDESVLLQGLKAYKALVMME